MNNNFNKTKDHLIVALDISDYNETVKLATLLNDKVAMIKIGLESYVAHGQNLILDLIDRNINIFLDLKLHDIPRTASAAAREVSKFKPKILTIHASGGPDMIRAVKDELPNETLLIAVTILTSLNNLSVEQIGFTKGIKDTSICLGKLAVDNGANGLVCSQHELNYLKHLECVKVVPGIRFGDFKQDDQKRFSTPLKAILDGANFIVVGRPIIQSSDPIKVIEEIDNELNIQ